MKIKILKRLKLFLIILTLQVSTACKQNSTELPEEYSRVKNVFNQIALSNDVGEIPILFTIVSGKYASYLAEETGICVSKEYGCAYFAQLNPFQSYDQKTDEILRQTYLYGSINGWAHSNGTIEIPRHVFRIIGNDDAKLACLIAHELAHISGHHEFNHSRELSIESKGMSEEEKSLLDARLSRKYEYLADKKSLELTFNAGYPLDSCIQHLDFLHKSRGDGIVTQEDSSHPGAIERIKALKEVVTPNPEKQLYFRHRILPEQWKYSKGNNYLLFTPGSQE